MHNRPMKKCERGSAETEFVRTYPYLKFIPLFHGRLVEQQSGGVQAGIAPCARPRRALAAGPVDVDKVRGAGRAHGIAAYLAVVASKSNAEASRADIADPVLVAHLQINDK